MPIPSVFLFLFLISYELVLSIHTAVIWGPGPVRIEKQLLLHCNDPQIELDGAVSHKLSEQKGFQIWGMFDFFYANNVIFAVINPGVYPFKS